MPETLIADRYRLGRVIGVGGMGVVYEAEQMPLRRTVALKMLPSDRVGSEEAVERLIREAQALSRIEHPGVVRVIDAGRASSGQAYLAMEYLEGQTLKQLLAEHGPLPWRWVLAAIGQCLEALEVVHRAGFVHRDIKPSNCFCCSASPSDGAPVSAQVPLVKLIDFGIAKAMRSRRAADALPVESNGGELVAPGPLIGTPAYWAPEQVHSGQATQRSDVYSMGATLYELLTGELPAPFETGKPEPPSAANPGVGIPPDLDAVVLKALSPDSERRFDSAAALHAALRAVEADRSQGQSTWPGVEPSPGSRAALPLPLLRSRLAGTPSGEGVQLLRLRAKVREFWVEGVLRASLLPALPGPPRTLEQELVAGLGAELQAPPASAVPEARSTAELFEHHGRSLLIVGSAGSGKTTQLLLVARQLLSGAQEEVPVVLTLSSWKGERRDLEDWVVSELRAKYQVPAVLSRGWLERGLILPLLDGLDEVPVRHRGAAIRAINRAIEVGRLPGLLVTSRSKEYLDCGIRLGLASALRLHPLRPATVDGLRQELSPFARLAPVQWDTLRPLLDSPLAVSLLSSALGSGPIPLAQTARGGSAQLADLLDVYTEQMIKRAGKTRLTCEPREFLEFLAQLAHEMSRNDTDIFAPDAVQPSWLEGTRARICYCLVSRCITAGIYASSLILSFGFTPLNNAGLQAGLRFGCYLAGFTTLTVGLVHGTAAARSLTSGKAVPLGLRQHWTRVALLALISGGINAVLLGLWANHPMAAVLGAEAGVFAAPLVSPHNEIGFARGDIRLIDRLRFSFAKALRSAIFGVVAGIIVALLLLAANDGLAMIFVIPYLTSLWFLFGGLRGRQVSTGARPYVGVIHSLQWSVALGALAVPLAALPTSITYGVRYGFYVGLTTGAVLWLWYGGMALVQHFVLRTMLSLQGARYFRTEYLEAAADRALLHRLGSGYLFVHPMLRASLARRWRPGQAH